MKILIFGSSGILGYKLYIKLKSNYKVYHNGLVKRKINLNYKNNKPFFKIVKVDGKNRGLDRNDTLLPLQYHLYFSIMRTIF